MARRGADVPGGPRHQRLERNWEPRQEFVLDGTLCHTMSIGQRCRVAGFGRGGSAQDGWVITAIERHVETGQVNVTVSRRQRTRVVVSERIRSQRRARQRSPRHRAAQRFPQRPAGPSGASRDEADPQDDDTGPDQQLSLFDA